MNKENRIPDNYVLCATAAADYDDDGTDDERDAHMTECDPERNGGTPTVLTTTTATTATTANSGVKPRVRRPVSPAKVSPGL